MIALDLSIIADFISTVGFPVFIAIYLVKIFSSLLNKENERVDELKDTLNQLNETMISWGKIQEVQMQEMNRIVDKLDGIIESNTKIMSKIGNGGG